MGEISVIIPSYNEEEDTLRRSVESLTHDKVDEIIIAESGENSLSEEFLRSYPKVKFIKSKVRSRAVQMNEGAKTATGDLFLFIHADTVLGAACIDEALEIQKDGRVSLVTFDLKFDSARRALRFMEFGIRVRNSIFCLPYGDQGYFVTKDNFLKVNGFDDVPLLEDVKFVAKLKKAGKVKIAASYVTTSARRYEKRGVFKSYLINLTIIILYHLGISPEYLKKLYERDKELEAPPN